MLLKLKILIIDDDLDFLDTLKEYLITKNCTIFTATTKNEAVKIVTAQKENLLPIDVAIIDYIIPEFDGIIISNELIKIDPHLFLVALTEHDDKESIKQIIHKGNFTQVISKFDTEEAIDRMIQVARSTKRRRRKDGID